LIIVGLNITLTGFICDFMLHHMGRDKVREALEKSTETLYGSKDNKEKLIK
jgi:hypothetical protein